ncbi:RHS repeat-associated core domain-containing protein [Litchfieldia salsa]|uniref:RHS repeat-associated core domain-containing protein n=1 Tax=Litchfieldia salsa TaxID=930152 RepID=A0A1H0X1R3_9BACI|nr:RHS repeat-associated core domain-containing protein [Litchfieldia salsa]SDP96416.1 RHS repeat-associated core domain-containing protein [Litchfieldia salsa]
MSKKIGAKVIIYFLTILLIGSSVLPGFASNAQAAPPELFMDPLLEEWLPQPGEAPDYSQSFLGAINQGATQGEPEVPSLLGNHSTQLPVENPGYVSPVEIPKGNLVLQRDDFVLPSYGFPITIQRLYKSSNKEKLSPFGYGWSFPYEHSIQMFADFHIAEFKSDGTQINYTFHKDDETLLVDEYDNDTNIYYPLDQGHYTTEGNIKSVLERISEDEYHVTHPNGLTYIFKGYEAPWRENFDAVAGKLVAVENRKGERMTFTYDEQGRLTKVTIQDGRAVTFTYNGKLISSMTDPIGRVTSYAYENQELKKVIYPDGLTESFTYDSNHRLISSTHSQTGTKTYMYLGDKITQVKHEGDIVSTYVYEQAKVLEKDALGQTTSYSYNDKDLITLKVDANGNQHSYQYDSRDRLIQVKNSLETITLQYDEYDNVTLEQSSLGEKSTIVYHPDFQLPTSITDEAGLTWKRTYDSNGSLQSIEYPLGEKEVFTLDHRGLVLEAKGIDQKITTFTYDSFGQLQTMKNQLGQLTTYTYDKVGRLLTEKLPNGSTTTYIYDKGNRVTSIKDAKGQTIQYIYDEKGRLVSAKLPNNALYQYMYNNKGQVVSKKEPNGATTSYIYNTKDQLVKVEGPLGSTVSYRYDALGSMMEQSGPLVEKQMFEYDVLNRPVKQVTQEGTWTYQYKGKEVEKVFLNGKLYSTYAYDIHGYPSQITNALGHTYNMTYDSMGKLLKVKDPKGAETTYQYNVWGNVTSSSDPIGRTTKFVYNDLQQVTQVINPEGHVTSYSYNLLGEVSKMTDSLGNVTTFEYDSLGQLTKEVDPEGNTTSYSYNNLGLVSTVTNARKASYQFDYDQMGQLMKITNPLNHTSQFSFDELGRMTRLVNEEGHETSYQYDLGKRVVKVTLPNQANYQYFFNDNHQLQRFIDPNGHPTEYTYDSFGGITTVKEAEGNVTRYGYDQLQRLIEEIDPKGQKVRYQYDAVDQLTSITDKNGGISIFDYNLAGELIAEVDALQNKTEYTYYPSGMVKTVKNPLGEVTSYQYDSLQRLTNIKNPLGHTSSITYDRIGNVLGMVDQEGYKVSMSYDANSNMTSYTDESGQSWKYTYDLQDQLTEMLNPLQHTRALTYTKAGAVQSIQDERGYTTAFSYDSVGNVTKVTDPIGYSISYRYDGSGNLTKMTDQENHVTSYGYDRLNRLIKEINPKGYTTSYMYDELGNLTQVMDAEGHITSYGYDEVGNMTSVTDALGNKTTHLYNQLGQLTKSTDANGNQTQWSYDGVGQLVKEINALGEANTYRYDQVGNLAGETNPKGQDISYSYNKRQELIGVGLGDEKLAYEYDGVGNMTKGVSPGATEVFAYDALSQVTSITNTTLGKTTQFTYDQVGNRTQIKDPEDRIIQYTYNERNEMAALVDPDGNTTSFAYHPDGQLSTVNRSSGVSSIYQFNENNQLTSLAHKGSGEQLDVSFKYSYDKIGNRLSQVEEDGAKTTYEYDDLSRLTKVIYPKEKIEDIRNASYTPPKNKEKNGTSNQDKTEGSKEDSDEEEPSFIKKIKTFFGGREKPASTSVEDSNDEEVNVKSDARDIKEEDGPSSANTEITSSNSKKETNGKEEGILSSFTKSLQAVLNRVVTFFKDIWKFLVDFFGGTTAEAEEVEHNTPSGKPDKTDGSDSTTDEPPAKGPNKEEKKEQPAEKGKGKPTDTPSGNNGKAKPKEEVYHGIGKGPQKWTEFYVKDEAFPEVPDYFKDPVRQVAYQYDNVGNRIKQVEDGKETNYVYNEVNELVQEGNDQFYYDANGNLVEKETKEGIVKYEYTTDNRLKGVYYPDGSQVEFTYDAFRRKASREQTYYDVKLPGNGRGKGPVHAIDQGNGQKNGLKDKFGEATYTETTQYLYDGMNVFKEYGENGQPLAQYYMDSNQVIARKMFGYHGRKQEGDEGNLRTRGGLLYYHEDGSGNIMDVTDRIGEQIMKYRYDAFGNLFTHMAAPHNTIGFSGKSYDAKASLIDFSARWYSPNEGRFISEDTFSGWRDQPVSLNRYAYVHNNPVTLIDPTGRYAETIEWTGQVLERGDRGAYVADLQQMLSNVGFSPGSIDGIFGPMTEGAVIGFQDYSNITVDGIAGPQTYRALVQYGGLGGSSSGGSTGGGSSSGGSGTVTPPPPTRAEIIAARSGHFRAISGGIPSYSVRTAQSVKNQYVFSSPTFSNYGFDFKPSVSALAGLAKFKKFRLPSSSTFKRQVGSAALDFIPVVGNIKSGLEAIIGKDLVTGKKLSASERIIAGVGIFTGGFGKSALKGARYGLGFAKRPSKGTVKPKKVNEGIYEFFDNKTGKPYIGQSKNIKNRLKQHEKSGKYDPNSSVKLTEVKGGKTSREIAEHKRIQEITGGVPARFSDKVANKVDPIGQSRRHLLK